MQRVNASNVRETMSGIATLQASAHSVPDRWEAPDTSPVGASMPRRANAFNGADERSLRPDRRARGGETP